MKLWYLVVLLAVVHVASAQDHWIKLEKPTALNLSKVCFMDSLLGWVAGDSGLVLKTANGGESWVSQQTGISENIFDFFMLDRSFGWALALKYPQDTLSYGTILLKTTNGGSSWTLIWSDTTKHLYAVSFLDANTGTLVAAGGTILRTTDGGIQWTVQTSGTTAWLKGVSFADASTGTVVGTGGTVLRTTNGGATWTSQTSGTTVDLFDVYFVDALTGTAVGNSGTILRTTNGGTTWTSQSSGTMNSLHGVSFTSVDTGTVVGQNGRILRTTNGGVLWTIQTSGTTALLHSVSFADANTATVVGRGGAVLRTTNGGATWTSQTSGTTADLFDVCFTGPDTGTAVGNGGTILRTTNGGTTWTSQWTGTMNSLYGVSITHADTGTVVGQNGGIFRTINGGTYWTGQEYPVSFFYAIFFFDSVNGLMGGERGKIRRTTDGGLTWSPATVDSSLFAYWPLLHFKFFSRNYGFAVGGRMDMVGIVWKTTNGGERWSATGPAGEPLHGFHFIDSLNLIAIGGDFDVGTGMVRSKDGGLTWEYTYLGIWGEARALAFRTPSEGYAPLGFPGTYMVTLDTGRTWHDFYTPDSSAVYDVTFTDSTHGFMVGANGTIVKYDAKIVGVKDNSVELPVTPMLHQNHPNPFNPTTSISYQLPSVSYVVLKVYDAVGREVKTLFRGNQEAGMHTLEFDGERLASGPYFCELTTSSAGGRTTKVRKMLLLK